VLAQVLPPRPQRPHWQQLEAGQLLLVGPEWLVALPRWQLQQLRRRQLRVQLLLPALLWLVPRSSG